MPVVAAGAGLVELAIISVAIFLILTRRAWESTLGKVLLLTADKIGDISIASPSVFGRRLKVGLGPLADAIRGANNDLLTLLGQGIAATEWAANTLWSYTGYVIGETGRVMGDLADQVYQHLDHLEKRVIPKQVTVNLHPLASKVEWVIHRLQHLDVNPTTVIHRTTRVLDPRVKTLERDYAKLQAQVDAIGVGTLAPPVAVPRIDLSGIHHGIDALRERINALAHRATPTLALAAVVAALGRLGLGMIRCRNIRRNAGRVCAMDADLLDSLLVGTLAVFGTVSLVEFAKGMQGIVRELHDGTTTFYKP